MTDQIEQRERELVEAQTALATAEQNQRDAEAEYTAAELAAPRYSQVDLAKDMARQNQARRAGLIP